jgi:hypothetical protein
MTIPYGVVRNGEPKFTQVLTKVGWVCPSGYSETPLSTLVGILYLYHLMTLEFGRKEEGTTSNGLPLKPTLGGIWIM